MSDEALIQNLTAKVVEAYVSNNTVAPEALAELVVKVREAFANVGAPAAPPVADKPTPAVPPKKSVFPDYIICLEDGKKLKLLRRHLKSAYNMTPEQYRERWDLPPEYPMVAPNYAKRRSSLARQIGLGQRRETVDEE
ncbi:MucR family transcriptional regulator [Acidomonas methanolica]|uniref:Transcriptional regulator Ros/MucR n=1 Tax=Acidomonas methanolica NBRC 104435 TaxID=1231351 RepID=A0A023D623_ACIMT|nr:MucR family transcriptional regulator [Acidomonas methanolica]MBU2655040.1 MucR family transcriptional regulator [Acidomonas methanolica]TCS25645.1 MucR family transcriptional regulator [Acidomonas methanolica]GAJ29241.1 transcriptional regulator Ros/MucR [Acidomonas methanolica NBRC 104435]GBQ53247.1 Ros/MucR family transcriptional regulator [Acidomonas methanolica]GEK99456.1 MucR family transcriptional regulator [Acidomonas methanolica NBRC 104435]